MVVAHTIGEGGSEDWGEGKGRKVRGRHRLKFLIIGHVSNNQSHHPFPLAASPSLEVELGGVLYETERGGVMRMEVEKASKPVIVPCVNFLKVKVKEEGGKRGWRSGGQRAALAFLLGDDDHARSRKRGSSHTKKGPYIHRLFEAMSRWLGW